MRCLAKSADVQQEAGGRHMHLVRQAKSEGTSRKRRTQIPSGEIKDGTLRQMLNDLDLDYSIRTFREKCRGAGQALS